MRPFYRISAAALCVAPFKRFIFKPQTSSVTINLISIIVIFRSFSQFAAAWWIWIDAVAVAATTFDPIMPNFGHWVPGIVSSVGLLMFVNPFDDLNSFLRPRNPSLFCFCEPERDGNPEAQLANFVLALIFLYRMDISCVEILCFLWLITCLNRKQGQHSQLDGPGGLWLWWR